MPWILNMQLNYVLIIRILTAVIRILSDRQVMFAKIGCQVLNFVKPFERVWQVLRWRTISNF